MERLICPLPDFYNLSFMILYRTENDEFMSDCKQASGWTLWGDLGEMIGLGVLIGIALMVIRNLFF
jgi:hypothetical protein